MSPRQLPLSNGKRGFGLRILTPTFHALHRNLYLFNTSPTLVLSGVRIKKSVAMSYYFLLWRY
jgi:hypothetical protein